MSGADHPRWHVPYFGPAERAETLRKNLVHVRDPDLRARFERRIEMLEAEAAGEQATILASPMLDRAPALARWAYRVQNDRGRPKAERAAAYEFEALAWEEIGRFEDAQRARRNAALELGARLDLAGFHTEANARA
jgi:hypothetical protein